MADENCAPDAMAVDNTDDSTTNASNASLPEKKGRLRVKVKKWHTVGLWKWDVNDDCCGICRSPFDGFCTDCKMPGDDCPPVWGACKHAFHMHCIVKWLGANTQQQCPMCRAEWQFRE